MDALMVWVFVLLASWACVAPDRGISGVRASPPTPLPPIAAADGLCAMPAPSAAPYAGLPSDYRVYDDQSWSAIDALGWAVQWGAAHVVVDTTAPFSPPLAAQIDFPIGFVGGAAAGTLTHDLPSTESVYTSVWWELSDPWQGHPSNSNKVEYLFTESQGSMAMIMYGVPGGPYELRVFPDWQGQWLRPNVTQRAVALGTWHHVEWLVQYGATQNPPSGTVRWWMDGELLGNYCDVKLPSVPLVALKLAPVWGGIESVGKTENDWVRYGPVRIAVH